MGEPGSEALRIEVPRALRGQRFDRALAELLPDHSRSQLQKLVRRGNVKVDGKRVVRSNFDVRGGERLSVQLDIEPKRAAASPGLQVLHSDEHLAVVNKPVGVLTHPTGARTGDSVSERAVAQFGLLPTVEGEDRPGIVHRLDRETSGVMVIARTPQVLDELRRQFRERIVEKRYLAIVHGVPKTDRTRIDQPLGPVPGKKDLQRIDPRGREALTDVEVLERAAGFARVACHPATGRRHQLRVHLASVGHPIAGDKLYRPRDKQAPRIQGLSHHALHASALAFEHPGDGRRLRFEAAPPASFEEAWARVRRGH